MQIHEKLKVLRLCKGWSQEEMAEKIGYSANGYAKVERGETDIKVDRLGKIAEAIGVDLLQLLNLNDKNVFNVIERCHYKHSIDNHSAANIFLTETQCANELEKSRLLLHERNQEIANLKQQIIQLQEINTLLKAMSGSD